MKLRHLRKIALGAVVSQPRVSSTFSCWHRSLESMWNNAIELSLCPYQFDLQRVSPHHNVNWLDMQPRQSIQYLCFYFTISPDLLSTYLIVLYWLCKCYVLCWCQNATCFLDSKIKTKLTLFFSVLLALNRFVAILKTRDLIQTSSLRLPHWKHSCMTLVWLPLFVAL